MDAYTLFVKNRSLKICKKKNSDYNYITIHFITNITTMKSATKSSSLESKQYFDEHKESTKSELHKITSKSKEDLSDKQKKVLTLSLIHI